MYIETVFRCSKCGSTNYESFAGALVSGKRCLNCGHESRTVKRSMFESAKNTVWKSTHENTF